MAQTNHPRKWMRRTAAAALVLLITGLTTGYIYERTSEARSARQYPMGGALVDIGGYRLHLECSGEGTPVVLLDSGFLDSSAQWERVQPVLSKITRTCSFDRAGSGWSDRSPLPRTSKNIAAELHRALERAGLSGPNWRISRLR